MGVPEAWQQRGFVVVLALALGLAGCQFTLPDGPEITAAARGETSSLEQEILAAVNQERGKRDLNPLAWSDGLLSAAREHSQRMAELGFFSHEDPELGGTVWEPLRRGRTSS
jgi:uncharacterized protein YkwD